MAAPRLVTPVSAVILALGALGVGLLTGVVPVPNRSAPEPPASIASTSTAGVSEPPATAPTSTADDSARAAAPPPELYSEWTTYDDALRQSRESGKPVLLDFNAEWCGPCQMLRREVFENVAAGTTVKAAVIPVSVVDRRREDGENPEQVEALQRRYEVEAFPTLVVFSPASGRALRKVGYDGDAETLRWITETAAALR